MKHLKERSRGSCLDFSSSSSDDSGGFRTLPELSDNLSVFERRKIIKENLARTASVESVDDSNKRIDSEDGKIGLRKRKLFGNEKSKSVEAIQIDSSSQIVGKFVLSRQSSCPENCKIGSSQEYSKGFEESFPEGSAPEPPPRSSSFHHEFLPHKNLVDEPSCSSHYIPPPPFPSFQLSPPSDLVSSNYPSNPGPLDSASAVSLPSYLQNGSMNRNLFTKQPSDVALKVQTPSPSEFAPPSEMFNEASYKTSFGSQCSYRTEDDDDDDDPNRKEDKTSKASKQEENLRKYSTINNEGCNLKDDIESIKADDARANKEQLDNVTQSLTGKVLSTFERPPKILPLYESSSISYPTRKDTPRYRSHLLPVNIHKKYPFTNRILTGKVKTLTKKFERNIASGGNLKDESSDEELEEMNIDKRMALLLSRLSERVLKCNYLSVNSRGDLIQKGPRRSSMKSSFSLLSTRNITSSKRLSNSLSKHDGELDLLVREGEAVSSRLRNVLTTSLRSPGPVFRRPLSTEPPRHLPPDPAPRRFSPGRLYRSDLTLDDDLSRSFRSSFTRSRSMSDIRQQGERSSTHRAIMPTSTPLRAQRDLFNASRPTLRDLSTIQSDIIDDTELYRLEEETRGLQEEVLRLEQLLAVSTADRNQINYRYNALSDHAADEWQEYQGKLQHFHDIHTKQNSLIERLANKVREYKGRCREYETRVTESYRVKEDREREIETLNLALATSEERLRAAEAQHTFDLETALIKLEDEQARCESLGNQVVSLQEKMTTCESSLAESAAEKEKLSVALRKLQEEMKTKETRWSQESQQFNRFYISEHKNLLDLWREVGAVKRSFGEVKTSTFQDLNTLKENLDLCSQQLKAACVAAQGDLDSISPEQKNEFMMSSPADLWARIQECERAQVKVESEKATLKDKINELNSRILELNNTLRDRERCIQDLNRKLDDGITEAEIQDTLREKVRTLETYLVDIAHTVIKDSEQSAVGGDSKSPPAVAFKLSRDPEQGVSPDLPQSTVSAVRTALSNRQVQIHDLQLKLNSSKEQLSNLRKQYESAEVSHRSLEATIGELRDELETASRMKEEMAREKDRLTEDLDAVSAEKFNLDKVNQSLKAQLESVGEDTEKRSRQVADLEKEKTGLVEEKAYMASKLAKEKEESQKLTHTINLLNSELASAQQQVSTLSDSLTKAKMAEEKVELQKEEIREQMGSLERSKIDMEAKVNFLLRQEADLKDALEKVEAYNINLGQDKSQLVSRLSALEAERATMNTERIEMRAEIERYKDELEALDDERGGLESNITSLNEKFNIATVEKEKTELELSDAIAERNEIHSHLTALERTRSGLEAEIESLSAAFEEKSKLVEQLNQDKEILTKENAEWEVKMASVDKEITSLKENLATLKAEKQSLENFSSSLEKKWSNNESKRTQLEKENQQLTTDRERISIQMNKLQRELETELSKLRDSKSGLERKLDEAETEHKKQITHIKDEKEEMIDNIRKEKNDLQSDMEDKINLTIHMMKQEMDDLEIKKDQELSSMKRSIEKLQRERDDSSLRYEEEKHKSLMMAQQEISSLEEKVSILQRDLSHYENQLEQLKREGSAKVEVGRANENVLQGKITQLKEELHSSHQTFDKQSKNEKEHHEKKMRDLQSRLDEMRRQHDMEMNSLKTDLRLSKEDTMRFQQDLEDAEVKLKDAQETRLCLKKEMDRMADDIRVAEERRASEWQSTIRRIDNEKKDLQKRLDERESKIGALEATEAKHADLISRMTSQLRELNTLKQDTQREISDLRRKLQAMETEGLNKAQEIETLRQRLCAEEDRHNESRKEASKLKAKHAEYERERENLQTELALLERRLSEMEDHHAAKEQELTSSLQEAKANERKLADEKKNLENYWSNANQQISELKVKLSREEGHVEALEQQLATLEANKEQLERKLHTVYASLRTVTRMYQDQTPGSPSIRGRKSKLDLEKPTSQADLDMFPFEKISVSDIDPESIRHELRSLMTQMNQVELERDDAVAKVANLERQLTELQESQQKSEARLRDVTRALSELEEKKRYTDDKLNKSSSQITQHEDALRRKESEIRALTEDFSNVRRKAADLELERNSLHDRLTKLKSSGGRLEIENADMKERLRAAEQRMSLVDESKGRLETDFNSLKKALSEKQLEIESLKGDKDSMIRNLRIIEDQNASLKNKVDDVKARLAVLMASEAELKDKLSSSNRSLKEHVSSSSSLQDELSRLQNQLSRNDNERRQLEERLAEAQTTAAELRRQKEQLSDSKSKLQQDLSNVEIKNAELDMNLKSLKGNLGERSTATDDLISKITRLEQEKLDLKNRLSDLERKLALTAAEKRDFGKSESIYDKDRLDLRKYLDKDHPLSGSERTLQDTTVSSLRIENMELRRRIDNLETDKTELQQKHLKETLDLSSDHRKDRQSDNEKMRRLTAQLESLRQEKERCLLRINALEQQINQYRDQIREYRSRSSAVAADVRRVRMSMTESLHNIGTHPRISSSIVDSEIQNLSGTRSPGAGRSGGSGRPSRRYGSLSPRRRGDYPKKTTFAAS